MAGRHEYVGILVPYNGQGRIRQELSASSFFCMLQVLHIACVKIAQETWFETAEYVLRNIGQDIDRVQH